MPPSGADDLPEPLPPEVRAALAEGAHLGATVENAAFALIDRARAQRPHLLLRRSSPATYRVLVGLDDVAPPVWRRLAVPSDLRLQAFHAVLQAVMGWNDSHRHSFRRRLRGRTTALDGPLLSGVDLQDGRIGTPEADARLDEVLSEAGDELVYSYDPGDGWQHTVRLESVEPLAADPRPHCTDGRRACPPEDSGGPAGYRVLLGLHDARVSGGHLTGAERARLDYFEVGDPEAFSVSAADAALSPWAGPAARDRSEPRFDTAGVPTTIAALLPRISHDLADALLRTTRQALAGGSDHPPTPEVVESLTGRVRWLLDEVGDEGLDLTPAGYLPTRVVTAAIDVLGLDASPGRRRRAPRESDLVPLSRLRSVLQTLGWLRIHDGRLLLTGAGTTVREDPVRRWEELAAAMPLGDRPHDQVCGLVDLLTVATGGQLRAGRSWATTVLAELGTPLPRTSRSPDGVTDVSPTALVLHLMGAVVWDPPHTLDERPPPDVVAFARRALRSS